MLRVGIIGSGFGRIGLKPAFASVRGCKIVGVSGGRDWRAFLEREDLDAVAIAVPPKAQYTIAKAAIQKGLHIFAEKPLAANLSQARELLALAKKHKVTHGIDLMFPDIAAWKKAKELLQQKKFGALLHVSLDWDWESGDIRHRRNTWRTRVKEGGGALNFYFSHGLYSLEHFAGELRDAHAQFSYSQESVGGGETGLDVLLQFKSGATGSAHVSCASPGRIAHQIIFQCEQGSIVLTTKNAIVDHFTLKTYSNAGEKLVAVKKDVGRAREDERVKIVRKLAQRFVQASVAKKQMTPSFVDGVRVQKLVEMIRARAGARRRSTGRVVHSTQ